MSQVTIALLCMTCCARLSATSDDGGQEAHARVEEQARKLGWVRVERHPGHVADVCSVCAAIISNVVVERLRSEIMRASLAPTQSNTEEQKP